MSWAPGFIYSYVHAFPLRGRLIRFPHLQIMPRRTRFLGLIEWPFFGGPFSRPGDSGSWVIEARTKTWLGMVIAGDKDFHATFVAEAQPLLAYFEGRIQAEHAVRGSRTVTPFTYP